jgi:TatD DNase family protein
MGEEIWEQPSQTKGRNNLIDSHCHIDQYPNPLDLAKECERSGIIVIGMTNLPSHFEKGYQHLRTFKSIRLALGMHPLLADLHEKEFPIFAKYIEKTSYVGEVGLDFSPEGLPLKKNQILSFERILQEVSGKKKLLSIHSRKAECEVLDYLLEYKVRNAIFHWYTGPLKLIPKIVDAGYYFSINTSMIKSKSGQAVIAKIPKNALLTESDGPFIKAGNLPVKPSDVVHVNRFLASFNRVSEPEMQAAIKNNFRQLISTLY